MKSIWYLFFSVCFVLSGTSLHCQGYLWIKDVGNSNQIGSICPLINGNLLVIDNRVNHLPLNQHSEYQDILVYNFNFTSGFGDSLLISNDSCFLFCANTINIDGHNFVGYGAAFNIGSQYYQPYLFWFDDNLNLLKDTLILIDTCNVFLQTQLKLSNNTWIISGTWRSLINSDLQGSFVVLLDESGKVTGVKYIKCNAPPLSFVEFPGLGGLHGVSSNSIRFYPYDFSYDSLLWQESLMQTFLPIDIALSIGSNQYVQCAVTTEPGGPPPILENSLFFRDQNALILDTVLIGIPDSSESLSGNGLRISSLGDILIGQFVNKGESLPGYYSPINHDMIVTCLQSNGTFKWRRKICDSVYFTLQYLAPMSDGGCVIAGTIWDWETTWPVVRDNMFLARLTQDGELVTGMNKVVNNKFTVYPNPANEKIMIDLGAQNLDFSLLDITGVKVLESSIKGNAVLNLKHIPNVMYIYYLKDNKQVVSSGKIIVTH